MAARIEPQGGGSPAVLALHGPRIPWMLREVGTLQIWLLVVVY